MSSSFQLPDLLGLTGPFDLRTNRHCRFVTDASEKWFRDLHEEVLKPGEYAQFKHIKAGLLAALCFPTCDPPQLRLLVDFLFVLVICHERVMGALSPAGCGWTSPSQESDADIDAVQCLTRHAVFGQLVPAFSQLVDLQKARKDWAIRFCRAFRAYHAAQIELIARNRNSDLKTHPKTHIPGRGVEAFLELRRKVGGWDILFLLYEALEDIRYEAATNQELDALEKMRTSTIDTLSWILDIAAYNNHQSRWNPHNLIHVLISCNHLSLQGAINYAANQIRHNISIFESTDALLFSSDPNSRPQQGHTLTAWLPLRWNWPAAPAITENLKNTDLPSQEALEDIRSIIRNFKDSTVGVANWVYETELYFGTKGEEVRIFGWVFLAPLSNRDG